MKNKEIQNKKPKTKNCIGKNWFIVIRIVLFLVIVGIITGCLSKVLIRKNEYGKYAEFYTEKENFDVLFFGSSRVLDAFSPMELWRDYGLTSYNMGQHNEYLYRNYWSVKNAIENNKPKIVVLDVSLFAGEGKLNKDSYMDSRAYLHNTLDHMPMGITKLDAIYHLVEFNDWGEYLFPIMLYHSRWSQLTLQDFSNTYSARKGGEARVAIAPQERSEWESDQLADVFMPEGVNLVKIMDLCEKEDVQLIMICMPVPRDGYSTTINSFENFAKENGIPFINIWRYENVLNYATDFADEAHVNPAGGTKLTHYIGDYLVENYTFNDKSSSTAESWNESYKEYINAKQETIIENSDDPAKVIMLMNGDPDFYCEVSLNDNSVIETMGLSDLFDELGSQLSVSIDSKQGTTMLIKVYRNDTMEQVLVKEY